MKFTSLKARIILLPVACLLLAGALVILFSVSFLRARAMEGAKQQILDVARNEGHSTQTELANALNSARTLAQLLCKVKDPDSPLDLRRYEIFDLLHGLLPKNHRFEGVFTCWEPDAFDGMDVGYTNESGHDASGRLAPYLRNNGESGEPELLSLLGMADHATDGIPGPWYANAKKTQLEQVYCPFRSRGSAGEEKLLTMAVVPIVAGRTFLGVVGIDVDLGFLQKKADDIGRHARGTQMLITCEDGIIAAASGEANAVGRPFAAVHPVGREEARVLASGREGVFIGDGRLHAVVPIYFGNSAQPWTVHLSMPLARVTEASAALMWQQIGIFSALIALIIVLALMGARSVTKPLSALVGGMRKVQEGDFSCAVEVDTADEIGELATIFNRMRLKLRKTMADLHQHQEHLENEVARRTNELQEKNRQLHDANAELQKAMAAIRDTQEELLQTEKLAVVGQMSGIVAHEVLNPMAAVCVRIEKNLSRAEQSLKVIDKLNDNVVALTETGEADQGADGSEAQRRKHLAMIVRIAAALKVDQTERLDDLLVLERLGQRVVRIVDGLRQMAKTKRHVEPVRFDALLREVLDDMAESFKKRHIDVVEQITAVPSLPADHMELYSIVSNLLRNAMQALEVMGAEGERVITVQLTIDDETEHLQLLVRDNGAGIPPERQRGIFEPGNTSKGREGTGLGLSFSRKVARTYHGDIVLMASGEGAGATFLVTLPLDGGGDQAEVRVRN